MLSVSIEHNDGRYKAGAKLLLEIPELLDEWPESRQNAFVKNKEVRKLLNFNSINYLDILTKPLIILNIKFKVF